MAATKYGGAVSNRLIERDQLYIPKVDLDITGWTHVTTLDMPKVATTVGMN